MMRRGLVAAGLALTLSAFSESTWAEAIMISGNLEAVMPQLSFSTSTSQSVAFVNSTTITASGTGTACNVTTDPKATSTVDNLTCVFEWLPNSLGLTSNGFQSSGIPKAIGDLKLPWIISYYSGSERTKVQVASGNYVLKTVAPVQPVITGMKSAISGAVLDGFSVNSYVKDEVLTDLIVQVEPRNYIQYISIGGASSCEVPENGSSCTITVGSVKVSDSDALQGARTIAVTANSKNNYFSPPAVHNLIMNWDYRPPVVDHTVWNFSEDATTINVGGTEIYTGPKTVAVAVKAPQLGAAGEWWLPTSLKLTLTPDGKFQPVTKVTLDDGTTVDFGQTWAVPSKRTLQPVSGPQLVGDEYLYIFNISDLTNGSYDASFSLQNKSGNISVYDDNESKLMLTEAPSVLALKDGQVLQKRDTVYFLNEIIVAAFQGQEGVADISSATIDNIAVDLTPTSHKGIYYLKNADKLTLNQEHTLRLVASNKYGKQATLEVPFVYMPMGFMIKGIENVSTLYSRVRLYTALVQQSTGATCTLFTTKDNAAEYLTWVGTNSSVKVCYVEWNNVPNGLEFYYKGRTPGLSGYFNNSGENLLDYDVYMMNAKGSIAKAAHTHVSLTATIPYNPIISYKYSKTIAGLNPNTALVYSSGGEAARLITKVVPANTDITVKQDDQAAVKTSYINRSSSNDSTTFTQRLKFSASSLWTKRVMDINVAYNKDPSLQTNSSLNVYTVPDFNIRTYMKVDDKKTATGLSMALNVNIGRYKNDCRCTAFDRAEMGLWDVVIYAQKSDYVKDPDTGKYHTVYERTALTQSLPVDDAGKVNTEVKVEGLDIGNHRLVAVATVRSPFADFKMTRESSTVSIRVYKGEEIEGGLSKSMIIGRIPLSTVVSFKTKSTSDADALSPTEWQISEDNGVTWTTDTSLDGHRSVTVKRTTVGKWLYRAKLKNKFTNIESFTDVLTVITYKKPKPSLVVSRVLEGNDIPVQILDNEEPINEGQAEIMWSEDNENWVTGGTSYTIKGSDSPPNYIYAKLRFTDADEAAEDQSWNTTSAHISLVKAKRLSVKTEGVESVEVGQKVTLHGSYTNPNEEYEKESQVSEEWLLPDGTIVTGSDVDVTLLESMLDHYGYAPFEYHAWLTKNKERTLARRKVSVKSWVYKFPEPKLNTKLKYTMVPTTLTASLTGSDADYPGVTFTREWMYDHEALTVAQDDGNKKVFNIAKAGTYTVTVLFKDNRGNESKLENTFTVDEQNEMKLDLTPKYSNKFMRTPLDLNLRAAVKLAHSADTIDSVSYKLNGEVIDGGKNYWAQYFPGIKEGKYRLEMDVVSVMGQRGQSTIDFDVIANQPPTCELTYTESNLSWSFNDKCVDADGKVSRYEWYINDEIRSVYGTSATLSKNLNKGKIEVKVIAYDDSGDTAITKTTVYGSPEK
ncbi:hypothetical protein [Yersinia intermedia]|uniref:hypothetical protein n=1 Tax=Yersinia intermedia TaxID=631 RepID=UPI00065D7767|nr:hypothetical protein [Yersinia intermedia]CRY84277.1 Protein of uncharacterised function (DUF3607) [Yersinia intermedia]